MRTRKRNIESLDPDPGTTTNKQPKRPRRSEKFLVDTSIEKLPETQLPLRSHIIQYYLFLRERYPKRAVKNIVSCSLERNTFRLTCIKDGGTCGECILSGLVVPWQKAGFKSISDFSLQSHVQKYIEKYIRLCKSQHKEGKGYEQSRERFKDSLKGLFWAGEDPKLLESSVAHDRLRLLVDKEEDLLFIRDQMTERKMHIGKAYKRFILAAERSSIRKSRIAVSEATPTPDANAELNASFQSTSEDSTDCSEEEFEVSAHYQKVEEEVTVTIPPDILSKTTRTADGIGLSHHQRVALISSVVANSGGGINKITLSHTSSHRISDKIIREDAAILRANVSAKVKITGKPIIVHFDSKIIKDFTGEVDSSMDRLCVLINHEGETHLLGVPGLIHGTGESQFEAIKDLLETYDLGNYLHGICFDTTASNTGRLRGACT